MPTIAMWGKGKSSKLLAKALNIKRNMRADWVIRYKRLDGFFAHEINTKEAIQKASNKYQSLCIMDDVGLTVPPFDKNLEHLDYERQIIFGRSFYHSKGSDITVYYPLAIFPLLCNSTGVHHHDYYIQYLKSECEYRYHVAFGRVILATKKVLANGEVDDTLIRNHQDGKWQQIVCKERPSFSLACITAVQAHGLDFGAVDFLKVNDKPVILEVNTAPGLQVENRLDVYVQAFQSHFHSRRG